MRSFNNNQRGLSLIEVLIALAVLSVGVMGVVGIFPTVSRHNANNWKSTKVMLLAQKTMDSLIAANTYIGTSPVVVSPSPPEIPKDAAGIPVGFVRYWGESDPGGNSRIQFIKVEVVWTEAGGTKRYLLTSAISP